jgi:outer membrane protein
MPILIALPAPPVFVTQAAAAALLSLVLAAAAPADVLTWEDCVARAAQNNPELRAARENLNAAVYQTKAARGGFLPQLSAGVNYTDQDTSSATSFGAASTYSASVTATQNLFAGFQDQAKVAQSRANQDITQASLDATKAKVSFDLKSAFAGLLYAQQSLKLTESIIQRRAENMRLVELRFEGGWENKGSLLLSRAALAQAELEHLQAGHALRVAQQQLAAVLGEQRADDLQIAGTIPLAEPEARIDPQRLVAQTPSHRQAVGQEQVAAAAVTLARAPLYPSLNLTATTGRQGNSWFPDNDSRSVGLSLSIPLYSGGRDYYGTQSAASSLVAARDNRERLDQQLATQLIQAHAAYVEAVQRLKVNQAFVEAASARAEIARNKYDNGLLSFEDWDIIENDLINRQTALVQSERDRILAEAAWEQAQGRGAIP